MSNHYYSKKPETAHNRQAHTFVCRGQELKLMTDAGVFSKTGVDYGSRVLIEHMELKPEGNILDVGCGYGPIGLMAAKLLPAGQVTLIDINERAVQLATENAKSNGISNVEVLQSDLYEAVKGKTFDVILTNPPIRAGKAVVHRIFEEGLELLNAGGVMWVVIQKKQGAPSALEKLQLLYDSVEEVTRDKGYWILKAIKA